MGDESRFSLAELAEAAGMTSRNVRAYQTRGLIPPPLRVGRRSEYTARHLEALLAIRRARGEGASLTLIGQVLRHGQGVIDLTGLSDDGPPDHRTDGADRAVDLIGILAGARVADDPAVLAVLERLVAVGVAARDGRRIMAGGEFVSTVAALHRRGLSMSVALQVATRAAESGAVLAARLGELLDPGHRSLVDQVADLATGVLRGVLAGNLAERAGASRG